MSLSLLAASIAFGWIGYRFGAPYGLLGGIGGAIAGVAIGFLATPLVLIAIIAFAHVGTRIESIFQKYKNG